MEKTPVSPDKKKTVGIVGFGNRGILHGSLTNIGKVSEWIAVNDTDAELCNLVNFFYPDIHFFSNLEEMMAEANPDNIFICTPENTHLPLVKKLASGGKNIFIDPPLSDSLPSSLEMLRLVANQKNVFALGYVFPFKRIFLKAKELLEEVAVDGIRRYRASWFCSLNSRTQNSERIVLSQKSTFFHLLYWLFGPLKSLYAHCPRILSENGTGVSLAVDHCSGLSGLLELSWSRPGYPLPAVNICVEATGGSLEISDDHLKLYLYRKKNGREKGWTTIDISDLPATSRFFLHEEGLFEANISYLECCERQAGPLIGWEDGLEVMRALEAVRMSAEEHRVIFLNEVQ